MGFCGLWLASQVQHQTERGAYKGQISRTPSELATIWVIIKVHFITNQETRLIYKSVYLQILSS